MNNSLETSSKRETRLPVRDACGSGAPHPVFSFTSGFSNTITRQRRLTTTAIARRSCLTHENCMHAEQIIIIFYIFYFIFCSMYLVLFSIVLYRTIVTVHTDNIFIYKYQRQMHQIIHLLPAGCFTPNRGKTVQKNREVSGVNTLRGWELPIGKGHFRPNKNAYAISNFLPLSFVLDNFFCWYQIVQSQVLYRNMYFKCKYFNIMANNTRETPYFCKKKKNNK